MHRDETMVAIATKMSAVILLAAMSLVVTSGYRLDPESNALAGSSTDLDAADLSSSDGFLEDAAEAEKKRARASFRGDLGKRHQQYSRDGALVGDGLKDSDQKRRRVSSLRADLGKRYPGQSKDARGRSTRRLRPDLGKRSHTSADSALDDIKATYAWQTGDNEEAPVKFSAGSDSLAKRARNRFRGDLGKRPYRLRGDLGKRRASFRGDLGKKSSPENEDDIPIESAGDDGGNGVPKRGERSFRGDLGKRRYSFRGDLGKREAFFFDADPGDEQWSGSRQPKTRRPQPSYQRRRLRFRGDLGKRRSSFREDLGKRSEFDEEEEGDSRKRRSALYADDVNDDIV